MAKLKAGSTVGTAAQETSRMNPEWGWNPAALQAILSGIVGVTTIGTLVLVYFALGATRRAARAAQEQAEISRQALEIAEREANANFFVARNASLPVIQLRVNFQQHDTHDEILVILENVGSGPAVNLQCWVECIGFDGLRDHRLSRIILAVREGANLTLQSDKVSVPKRDDRARAMAQYQDLAGRLFQTTLHIDSPPEQGMYYTEVSIGEDARLGVLPFQHPYLP